MTEFSRRPSYRALQYFILLAALLIGLMQPVTAQELSAFNVPPSAKLTYSINANVKGLSMDGEGFIDWTENQNKYSLSFETRTTLLGTLLSQSSEGTVDQFGIAPQTFTIKRFRKTPLTIEFDRIGKQVNFPGNATPHSLQGGEQDKLSVMWQLLSVARGAPQRFVPGSTWNINVVGQHDTETWQFEVKESQRMRTALGSMLVWHVVRVPEENSKSPQMDIWLAPSLDWFPVKLRILEKNGDYVEQSLEKVTKK